ncbi:hypothetical protein OESDEN_02821 [Oesophagostomum dentatum]|uniref:C2 domain-containing protein n=1 Tax=Oesophagostomum dentatum TaxID=61180 RepID=A0A0B1TPA3_OESDE|nr:hypothetical protein OESDEN_02821 [Oesophagostomum dentatum]
MRSPPSFCTERDRCGVEPSLSSKLNEKSTHITVTVSHKTKFGGADVIGKCEVPLDQAKKIGGHMWFALKKKKDDDKYRGEIQLQFTFSYEKPSLSISNTSLDKIEKGGAMNLMYFSVSWRTRSFNRFRSGTVFLALLV